MEWTRIGGGHIFKQDFAPSHYAKTWSNFRRVRYQGCKMTWKHTRQETYQKFVENSENKVSGERLHHLNQAHWSYCCHMVPWWNIALDCQKLVESMPKHVEQFLTKKGDHIAYFCFTSSQPDRPKEASDIPLSGMLCLWPLSSQCASYALNVSAARQALTYSITNSFGLIQTAAKQQNAIYGCFCKWVN